jgi:hypothetical protein
MPGVASDAAGRKWWRHFRTMRDRAGRVADRVRFFQRQPQEFDWDMVRADQWVHGAAGGTVDSRAGRGLL